MRHAAAGQPGRAAMRGAAAEPLFDVRVTSLAGGNVLAAGGLSIGTRKYRASPDLLVVPGMDIGDRDGCTRPHEQLAPEVKAIARAFARGAPVASMCVGAFLLAEAGLLDGRRATTSWMFAADLARRFPLARVDPPRCWSKTAASPPPARSPPPSTWPCT